VMPVILEWEYVDGSKEVDRIPAELWKTSDEVSKGFVKRKEVKRVTLDPFLETADCDLNNNSWPPRMVPTRFDVFKGRERRQPNPMQQERNKVTNEELDRQRCSIQRPHEHDHHDTSTRNDTLYAHTTNGRCFAVPAGMWNGTKRRATEGRE